MPGRQSHGRPLLPTPGGSGSKPPGKSHVRTFNNNNKSRAKSTAKALDAFALASSQFPDSTRGVRTRGLEGHDDGGRLLKRPRGRDDDDDSDDGEDGFGAGGEDGDGGGGGGGGGAAGRGGPKKRGRREEDGDGDGDGGFDGFSDDDGEGGSDSEEWHVGVGAEDEDSELDSDEAFGESDEEKFDGYALPGKVGKGKKGRKVKKRSGEGDGSDEEEEGDDDEDLESLGSDAIDLATALDQFEEDEEDEEEGEESGSEEDEESTDADDESEEDEDDDDNDPSKLAALENVFAGFGEDDEEVEDEPGAQGKVKLSLKDLGLAGVKDPHMKRSLRLMNKEEKAVKPGSSKKLEIPLAQRQQDRLLRSAAYEKTNETLDKWIDTVKHNRRADHLVFPLAQNAQDRGLDSGELMPITQKTSGTELEQTILAIMEESGLGPTAKTENKEGNEHDRPPGLSQAEQQEIARQRRREREMHSREQARAKRIKKIKSKAYRRIHRKELAREEEAEREEALAAGELDSDDEREALDRRRAMERMGTRHRESKWAKLGKKAGRAVWDDDFRAGLTDMARRKEDLRRRIEGQRTGDGGDDVDDDEGSDVSDASDNEGGDPRRRLLADLERAAAYDDDDEKPQSGLMAMKFMQRGEELRKKENEEAIAALRRELDSDAASSGDEEAEVGRKQFGMGNAATTMKNISTRKAKAEARGLSGSSVGIEPSSQGRTEDTAVSLSAGAWSSEATPSAPGAAGAWAQAEPVSRKSKKGPKAKAEEFDLSNAAVVVKAAKPKAKSHATPAITTSTTDGTVATAAEDSEEDDALHLPMAIRDQHLIERAFAGEDVHGQFEEEKAEMEQEDDEKEVDNTLPGWGNWVGDGVSNREKKKHQGRFVTKVEGVKKKDRKDYKLKDVIISEKRIRKLPHPFESQQQYERSLRLPVGPEWSTKETFQQATKPRVIVKQGVIAPMSKPMY
ncbi:Utp14 protein-domain-containing protein [Dichotomopilus funicola]|uniref:Utp14 protein-domain-containing protein n=1 Tax=Dichotomopilus funicola TaxID=1934379 RepID=A0AAN6V9T6_9PEZI|nr:Utp14 protein-domain-containing protein [Dichotomopilus funicola]